MLAAMVAVFALSQLTASRIRWRHDPGAQPRLRAPNEQAAVAAPSNRAHAPKDSGRVARVALAPDPTADHPSMLSLPFLSDADRQKIESPEAAALSWVVWTWMDQRLKSAGCWKDIPLETDTEVAIHVTVATTDTVARSTGGPPDIRVIAGQPLADAVRRCVTDALSQQAALDLKSLDSRIQAQVKRQYGATNLAFAPGFSGTAGGVWPLRAPKP